MPRSQAPCRNLKGRPESSRRAARRLSASSHWKNKSTKAVCVQILHHNRTHFSRRRGGIVFVRAHERAPGHCPQLAVRGITRTERTELLSAVVARAHAAKTSPTTHNAPTDVPRTNNWRTTQHATEGTSFGNYTPVAKIAHGHC